MNHAPRFFLVTVIETFNTTYHVEADDEDAAWAAAIAREAEPVDSEFREVVDEFDPYLVVPTDEPVEEASVLAERAPDASERLAGAMGIDTERLEVLVRLLSQPFDDLEGVSKALASALDPHV